MKPEEQIQVACVELLNLLKIMHFHVPNESRAPVAWRAKMKRMGLMPGAVDLVLMWDGGGVGFIEVKSPTGTLNANQKRFRKMCNERGHLWALVRSVDDMRAVVEKWIET